jgi:hypothetical protein
MPEAKTEPVEDEKPADVMAAFMSQKEALEEEKKDLPKEQEEPKGEEQKEEDVSGLKSDEAEI